MWHSGYDASLMISNAAHDIGHMHAGHGQQVVLGCMLDMFTAQAP
jgi:predicted HD phosphohydrolase